MQTGIANNGSANRALQRVPVGRMVARAGVGGVVGGVAAVAGSVLLAAGPAGWIVAGVGFGIGALVTALRDYLNFSTEIHRRNVVQTEGDLRQDIARAPEAALTDIIKQIENEGANFAAVRGEAQHRDLHLAALERRLDLSLRRLRRQPRNTWASATNVQINSHLEALRTFERAFFTWSSHLEDIRVSEQKVRCELSLASSQDAMGLIAQLYDAFELRRHEVSQASLHRCLVYGHEIYFPNVRLNPVLPTGVKLEEPV